MTLTSSFHRLIKKILQSSSKMEQPTMCLIPFSSSVGTDEVAQSGRQTQQSKNKKYCDDWALMQCLARDQEQLSASAVQIGSILLCQSKGIDMLDPTGSSIK